MAAQLGLQDIHRDQTMATNVYKHRKKRRGGGKQVTWAKRGQHTSGGWHHKGKERVNTRAPSRVVRTLRDTAREEKKIEKPIALNVAGPLRRKKKKRKNGGL